MTASTNTIRRATIGVAILGALGWATVAAQFGPPSTIYGSVTDEAGPVAAGLPVEAYIGDKLCGKGKTEFTGDGAARVAVYATDVFSREQTPGCGFEGAEVRIKIGERFATQTAKWTTDPNRIPVHVDVTFGSVQPAVIPTFTPAPKTSTPLPAAQTAGAGAQSGASQTPGTEASGTPGATLPPAALTATATLSGGVISSASGDDGGGDDGGGFPFWGVVVLVLGGIAVLGGGAGLALARSHAAAKDANSDSDE